MADIDRLRRVIEQALETPFPDHPESAALDDLMMDLDELDGYIVGLAESVIRGKPAPSQISDFSDLERKFATVQPSSPGDARILEQCRQIFVVLHNIVEAMRS